MVYLFLPALPVEHALLVLWTSCVGKVEVPFNFVDSDVGQLLPVLLEGVLVDDLFHLHYYFYLLLLNDHQPFWLFSSRVLKYPLMASIALNL